MTEQLHILCVDDEPKVLEGLVLNLRRHYRVSTANNGQGGLAIVDGTDPPAVVVSDMRMPEMDGAAFLSQVKERSPDTVRLLLTGQADLESAIAAVNHGQVFRFLTKPCAPPTLLTAIEAAVAQHRLITAERELLEKTLRGSIKALTEILSLASPLIFGRATRLKQHATELVAGLGVPFSWQLEVAVMLSQIGCIVLTAENNEKLYYGKPLSPSRPNRPSACRRFLYSCWKASLGSNWFAPFWTRRNTTSMDRARLAARPKASPFPWAHGFSSWLATTIFWRRAGLLLGWPSAPCKAGRAATIRNCSAPSVA